MLIGASRQSLFLLRSGLVLQMEIDTANQFLAQEYVYETLFCQPF